MSDSLLSSLQRLHAAAWNKGDNVSGVFAQHPVSWDPGSNFTDARLQGQKTVIVIRWKSGVDGKQHLLERYNVNAILIRDEYSNTLREIIRHASVDDSETDAATNFQSEIENPFRHQLPKFDMSGVSVTGTPGIGKSMFLIYVLVLRLLAGKPAFFRDTLSHGYLFDANGVFIVSSDVLDTVSQPEGTWFLVDSGQELESVTQDIITACRTSNGFVIQSAPPRTPNFAWFTKIGNRMPWKIYMAPWSLEELIAGRDLQRHSAHLSGQQIKDFTEKFGTSARYVYGGAHTPSSHERLIKEKIRILNFDIMKDLINVPVRDVKFDEYLSHLYLFNIPHPNDNRTQCIMGIPTRYLTEKVYEHLRRIHRVPTGDLYQYFVTNAFTGGSAGYLLERLFFEQFPEGGEWPMKKMKRHFPSTKNVHWHYDEASTIQYLRLGWQGLLDIRAVSVGNIPPGAFQAVRRISFADGEQLTLDYAFYIPLSKSQVSFDAFVFTAGSVATIFQVTVKKKHEIKVDGLSWLENLGARYMDLVVVTCPNKEALGGCDDIKVVESHAHMLRNVYHLRVD